MSDQPCAAWCAQRGHVRRLVRVRRCIPDCTRAMCREGTLQLPFTPLEVDETLTRPAANPQAAVSGMVIVAAAVDGGEEKFVSFLGLKTPDQVRT